MKTILIVENMDTLRELVCDELKDSGYDVISAHDTGEARNALQDKQPPDLALLDIKLPGESGVEFAKYLKSKTPQLPVIFCSAYWDNTTMAEISNTEIADFMLKPFDLDALKKRIKEIVGE